MSYELDHDGLRIAYSTTSAAGISDWIGFTETATNFGGRRQWLECPGCAGACRIVYRAGGGFKCRKCCRLTYQSQRERSFERQIGIAQRRRMLIGGDPNLTVPFPLKPKHMHWSTYSRQVEADRALIERWTAGAVQKWRLGDLAAA